MEWRRAAVRNGARAFQPAEEGVGNAGGWASRGGGGEYWRLVGGRAECSPVDQPPRVPSALLGGQECPPSVTDRRHCPFPSTSSQPDLFQSKSHQITPGFATLRRG